MEDVLGNNTGRKVVDGMPYIRCTSIVYNVKKDTGLSRPSLMPCYERQPRNYLFSTRFFRQMQTVEHNFIPPKR
jgi:hypothetical protein